MVVHWRTARVMRIVRRRVRAKPRRGLRKRERVKSAFLCAVRSLHNPRARRRRSGRQALAGAAEAIRNIYHESRRTAHEWLTWRCWFKEFAPLLFR